MKKIFKRILAALTACLMALAVLLPTCGAVGFTAPISASAETETSYEYVRSELSDGNYSWIEGAAVNKSGAEFEEGLTRLGFYLQCRNASLENFVDSDKDKGHIFFTLYHQVDEKTVEAVWRVLCYFEGSTVIWMHRALSYGTVHDVSAMAYLGPNTKQGNFDENYYDFRELAKPKTLDTGIDGVYVLDTVQYGQEQVPFVFGDRNGIPTILFEVLVDSATQGYFVEMDYSLQDYVRTKKVPLNLWDKLFGGGVDEDVYETTAGRVGSATRSILGILESIEAADALETEFSVAADLEKARAILGSADAPQEVQVSYLRRIGETPFAEKVTETVTLPVISGNISKGDVSAALGAEVLTVLNSHVDYFALESSTPLAYKAVYLKGFRIDTKTVDGEVQDQYLDVNLSYAEYFKPLLERGYSGLYRYLFDRMMDKYAELALYEFDEVYGYFGQTWVPVIPELSSADALFASIMDVETKAYGLLDVQKTNVTLTWNEHTALMDDYGYNALRALWNKYVNLVTLENCKSEWYLYYADVETDYGAISPTPPNEMGIIDQDGVFENQVQQTVQTVVKTSEDLVEDFTSMVGAVTKGANDAVENSTKYFDIIVFAALIVGGVWVYSKIRLWFPKKRKKKKK